MPKLPVDPTLLQLYIDGRCSPGQLAIVQQYLHDPAYQESLQEWLLADWQRVSGEAFQEEAEAAEKYGQFLALVQPAAALPVAPTPVKRMWPRRWWQVAAAAVFIVAMGWLGWQWQQQEQQQQVAMREQEWVQHHNEAGKRTVIFLPDSSEVHLNAVSSLQYNKNYGITNRNILLDGEAFFVVKHGQQHPFSVRSGSLTTVDIGTAFNIRHRQADSVVKVGVAEGAVNVLDHSQPQARVIGLLTQQQQLSYAIATRQAIIDTLPDAEQIGGWRDGILAFRQQSLQEVAQELERYYGIHIRFARPQTAHIQITTTIRESTATEALDIIALTAGVVIERSGTTALIK